MGFGRIALGATLSCSFRLWQLNEAAPHLMNLLADAGPRRIRRPARSAVATPESLTELPAPTPGGSNITGTDARGRCRFVALAAIRCRQQMPSSSNAGLVNYAGRLGRSADIRQTLAAEDLDWRRTHDGRFLQRLFGTTVYYVGLFEDVARPVCRT